MQQNKLLILEGKKRYAADPKLLASDLLKLPKAFGLHGTCKTKAEKLIRRGKLDPKDLLERKDTEDGVDMRGFYMWLCSRSGFDFKRGWEDRVIAHDVIRSVLAAIDSALDYAFFDLDNRPQDVGFGIVLLELEPRKLRSLRDDMTTSCSVETSCGPIPKYVPLEKYEEFDLRASAVLTDTNLDSIITSLYRNGYGSPNFFAAMNQERRSFDDDRKYEIPGIDMVNLKRELIEAVFEVLVTSGD